MDVALSTFARALLDRVEREVVRIQKDEAGPTELVGGWARIGSGLDALLRAAWQSACESVGKDPAGEFRREVPGVVDLDRGTAGQFARVLVVRFADCNAPREVATLVRDMRLDASALGRAIDLRNAVVHNRRDPTPADALPVLRELARLLHDVLSVGADDA